MTHKIDTAGLVARILGPLTHSTADAIRWLRLEIDTEPAAPANPAQEDSFAPGTPDGMNALAAPASVPAMQPPTPAPLRWERAAKQPPAQSSIAVRPAAGQPTSGAANEWPEQVPVPHSREPAGYETDKGVIAPPGNASGTDVVHAAATGDSTGMPSVAATRETSRPANTMPTALRQIPAMTATPASAMTPVPLPATHAAPPQAPAGLTSWPALPNDSVAGFTPRPTAPNDLFATMPSIENRPAAPIWARKNSTQADNRQSPATATPVFAAAGPVHVGPLGPTTADVKPSMSPATVLQNPVPASSIILRAPAVPAEPANARLQQPPHDSGVPATSAISTVPNASSEFPLQETVTPNAGSLRAQSIAQPMMQDTDRSAITTVGPMHGGAPFPMQNFGSAHGIPPASRPMQPAASRSADAPGLSMRAQPPGPAQNFESSNSISPASYPMHSAASRPADAPGRVMQVQPLGPAQNFDSSNSISPASDPMQPAASRPADAPGRVMQAQPLGVRMVARRLEQAMAPVFDRAHAAIEPAISINAGLGADNAQPLSSGSNENADGFPPSQVKNTFNVNVSLAGGERYGPAELEQMRDALIQVLGEAARRQGLDV